MIKPRKPTDEADRLGALQVLGLLDTPQEERYDRLVRKLAKLLDVPIAYVALIDADRQWMKCRVGEIPGETSRDDSFCGHTILANKPLIVPDTLEDERFADNPMVTGGPKLRFYAGIPLSSGGHNIGTLCIADSKPRELSAEDLEIVKAFASLIQQNITTVPKVFISYCHRDEEWKDRLLGHLKVLEEQGLVSLWDDRQIDAGAAWKGEIQEAMESSNLAILLISANYLTSRFILDEEVPRLLQRRDREGLSIVPLVIKPCSWQRVSWLEQMNLYPRDGKPLAGAADHEIDGDLATLATVVLEKAGERSPEVALAAAEPIPSPTMGPLAQLRESILEVEGDKLGPLVPAPPTAAGGDSGEPTPAADGPPIKLTVRRTDDATAPAEALLFRKRRISIGRGAASDIHLADPDRVISSRHARLEVADGGVSVVDLGSKNFTYLDGAALEPEIDTPLPAGAPLVIGGYEIRWAPLAEESDGGLADETVFAADYQNPFSDDASLLADVLRRVSELYENEASTRRDDALEEALSAALDGDGGHPALGVVGGLLKRN